MSIYPHSVNRPVAAAVAAMLILVSLILSMGEVQAAPVSAVAAAVWGQPDFFTVARQCNHASSTSLCGPAQVVTDARGNLWVADLVHNRVLMFPPGSAIAAKVLGQYGSMATRGCDQPPPRGSSYPPAPNRYTLCQPAGLAIDAHGTLYVADSLNNRILVFVHAAQKPAAAPADRVLGQLTFHASASNDLPAGGQGSSRCAAPHPASACTLNSPMELSLTPQGDLLVPDLDNHRVLLWPATSLAHLRSAACVPSCHLPAARVWGQYGSFATTVENNPLIPVGSSPRCTAITVLTPASACTLSEPWSALADSAGHLFIADTANNRVLEYDDALAKGQQDATAVYGQQGSFVTASDNRGGLSASSLWHPLGLAFDPSGRLWVTDFYNMRVLGFPDPNNAPSEAGQVLGQGGDFTRNGCAQGAEGLCGPTSISFGAQGHAWVADGFNDRILEFFSPPLTLARVDHVTVTHQGSRALIRWHSVGPIRGFALYLGRRRLTGHLLSPDPHGECRDDVLWSGGRAYVLRIVLKTGQEVTVTAG